MHGRGEGSQGLGHQGPEMALRVSEEQWGAARRPRVQGPIPQEPQLLFLLFLGVSGLPRHASGVGICTML